MVRPSLPRADARTAGPGVANAGQPSVRGARPRWWAEITLLLVCYAIYSAIRNLVPTDHEGAIGRAYEILRAEDILHLDIEYGLNRLFMEHTWLGVTANYYYATLHFIVTIGVMVWLYARHPGQYTKFRWVLFATTVIGLIGFWRYPLAPPRMLPGFTDTVVELNTWGLYSGESPVASVSNQYAAMPSLHTAWSVWCAVAVIVVARRRWVKMLALVYPALTILFIMGTANHFILDAVGGIAVLGMGFVFSRGAVFAAGRTAELCRNIA